MTEETDTIAKRPLLTILGFILATVSVFTAHWSDANVYEISIYASTPDVFWVSIVFCFIISLLLSISPHKKENYSGNALMFLSFAIIIFLPIMRRYHYIGEGDSLTHLGYARSFLTNILDVTDILYPGIHVLSVFFSSISGTTVKFSMMFISLFFLLIFIISSFLVVRAFITYKYRYIGIFLPGLLLPVNLISVHLSPHPTTSAILYLPFLVFAYARYSQSENTGWLVTNIILYTEIVFLHPQIGATVLLFYIIIVIFELAENRLFSQHSYSSSSALITVLNLLIFWSWSSTRPRFARGIQGYLSSLFVETGTATQVTQRSASLSELGSGLDILATKLFLVSFITSLTSLLVVAHCFVIYSRQVKSNSTLNKFWQLSTDRFIIIIALGAVPAFGLFLFTLVIDITTQYFRYHGFIMVIVTIISTYSVKYFHAELITDRLLNMMYIFGLVLMLVLSLLVYFPSPYILQPNNQVTESQIEGYETGLEHSQSSLDIMSIRSPPSRYFDAQIVPTGQSRGDTYRNDRKAPDHFANQNLHQRDLTTYVAVTSADYKRDVKLYKGFRFNKSDFEYLESTPEISKVHSSGGTTFYLID